MQACKKPGTPKDNYNKENFQCYKGGFFMEDRALMHSCKKPGTPKDISNKENYQSNKGGLSWDA
eukprot:1031113-Ditylum_brightwellii.AAC.1